MPFLVLFWIIVSNKNHYNMEAFSLSLAVTWCGHISWRKRVWFDGWWNGEGVVADVADADDVDVFVGVVELVVLVVVIVLVVGVVPRQQETRPELGALQQQKRLQYLMSQPCSRSVVVSALDSRPRYPGFESRRWHHKHKKLLRMYLETNPSPDVLKYY